MNHELFLSRSFAEHQLEMLEDLAHRREELYDQLGEKDVNVNRIMDHINVINRVFGDEPEAVDPLIDKWEQELMEGKIPNLDEGLEE